MSLAEKIRKSREKGIEAGGFKFIIRRPTDLEMMEHSRNRNAVALLRFVVGWESVKELDLIPGGQPIDAPFEAEACLEWLSDRPDLMGPVVEAIVAAYQEHFAAKEAAAKN